MKSPAKLKATAENVLVKKLKNLIVKKMTGGKSYIAIFQLVKKNL